jgi:proteic killer suppression protein
MPASAVSSISRYVLPLPLPERGGSIEVLRSFDVKRHHRYFLTNDRELPGCQTERFAKGERVKEFSGFARQAEKRLDRLEAATSLQDLAALPGNALEPLRGDRKGQYSIRINDQWRICFEWPKGANGPVNVEITD